MALEHNAIFIGQWNSKNERHGKGKAIFSDGSIVEAHWKNGKVNGRGRQIHENGDYYIGDWKNDM